MNYNRPISRENPSSERPPEIEMIRAEARGIAYRPAKRRQSAPTLPDPENAALLFTVCTGSRWMELGERQPEAKMLFGELWHQGELAIMFADTNVGKSVLAVQLGDNIAKARKTGTFACSAKKQRVLYVDFELSTAQFYHRYKHPDGNYEFSGNFFRAQFNPANDDAGDLQYYHDAVIAGLEYKINLVKATVLIIDNITCLRGGTESAAVALRLMNSLKSLKAEYNLSILVLAHTPKRRNPSRPISADDMHGSKLLINFADSAFAIGRSAADHSLCYLKQIKQRNTQQRYGDDNVCLCRITRPGNFLHFTFNGYSPEQPHLRTTARLPPQLQSAEHERLLTEITALTAEGLSQREISRRLNIALGLVNKMMRR